MTSLAIKRVIARPTLPADPSTMYLVRASATDVLEIYVSNNDGTDLRHLLNKAEVAAMFNIYTAASANTLATARDIELTGDITGVASFDGSQNVQISSTLADSGVAAGSYTKVTVDSKGRVTDGDGLVESDIPSLNGSKIVSDISVNTSGNAATATALQTARTINGVSFNGTADIEINAVDSIARIAESEKGAAFGVATLDAAGLVPSSQLPSYVDDVLEFANLAAFPAEGEGNKIYVAVDTNSTYRWTGTQYVHIPSGVGVADEAVKLVAARSIATTGDATWTVNFDGSANVSAALTLANSGVAAGEYPVVTVDAKGRVTGGRALVKADIPTLDYTTVTSAASVELAAAEW